VTVESPPVIEYITVEGPPKIEYITIETPPVIEYITVEGPPKIEYITVEAPPIIEYITVESPPKIEYVTVENPGAVDSPGYEEEKWLYLGARIGAGSSIWFDKSDLNPYSDWALPSSSRFYGANAALQASLHLLRFFDLQAEVNLNTDFENILDTTTGKMDRFYSWTLTVPVMAKLLLRGAHTKAAIFAGPYFYIPLFLSGPYYAAERFEYKPNLLGILFGMNAGWKIGGGYLFLDSRFEYDGHWGKRATGISYRNTLKVSLGYERGFFIKK
jgi:hypothetical protein